jgi:hypothetical protein
MNKRLIAILSILSLSLSLPLIPAHSATKAGAKCTKVGSKSVVGNKTFTCIKSGKKLVWDKGKTSGVAPVLVIPDSWPIDKAADKNIFLIADKSLRKFQQLNTTKDPRCWATTNHFFGAVDRLLELWRSMELREENLGHMNTRT